MSNFFAFEYTTARTAVNALFNQGAISEQASIRLVAGYYPENVNVSNNIQSIE